MQRSKTFLMFNHGPGLDETTLVDVPDSVFFDEKNKAKKSKTRPANRVLARQIL